MGLRQIEILEKLQKESPDGIQYPVKNFRDYQIKQ